MSEKETDDLVGWNEPEEAPTDVIERPIYSTEMDSEAL